MIFAAVATLVLIQAFFAGAEIALLSGDRLALQNLARMGHSGSKSALALIRQPERIFSTTLLMTSLCVVTNSVLIALWVISWSGPDSDLIAILITSPIIVLLGELIPKTLFQLNASRVAPWVAPIVTGTFYVFYPITAILGRYTSRLSRAIDPIEELIVGKKRSTREELRALISSHRADLEIPTSQRLLIRRILDFRGTEAHHALIPLVKVDAVELEASVRDALESFQRHRHSRMPVYSDRIDNIVGILDVADLFSATDVELPVRNFMRQPHYAPEAQELEDLIREMRSKRTEMCIVVDEYGGAVGALTVEDIIEEIVGEIRDEFDPEGSSYREISEGRWWIPGKQEITQLNEALQLEIPEGPYETIGGFLLQQFGRIPEAEDEIHFNTPSGQFRFVIQRANARSIQAVILERLDRPERPGV
ncbi:MAG: hemolysin family protein [Oligoflexia bacterium]